ncbi:MAG: hypothetical protein HQ581_24550 [Planctomycetes bacterium]|nr:hypothetical protein [Planctomycetota bacterium]
MKKWCVGRPLSILFAGAWIFIGCAWHSTTSPAATQSRFPSPPALDIPLPHAEGTGAPLDTDVELPFLASDQLRWVSDASDGDTPRSAAQEPVFLPLSDPREALSGPRGATSANQPLILSGDHTAFAADAFPASQPSARSNGWPHFARFRADVRSDYRNYYSWNTARGLLWGLAGGAVLANTSLDEDIQDGYQDDVRSPGTDNFSAFWKTFGDGRLFIPAYIGLAVAGRMCDEMPICGLAGDFGGRVTRGYLVGAPPVLLMQFVLGASRPGETNHGSEWRMFEDNNAVSGHAFIGAVPFITAAQMTEKPLLKGIFYACSVLPAYSRVNDDCHYVSQICLGWWMAYLACQSVNETNAASNRLAMFPIASPQMVGAGLAYRF